LSSTTFDWNGISATNDNIAEYASEAFRPRARSHGYPENRQYCPEE
jgi:hypothetical protein